MDPAGAQADTPSRQDHPKKAPGRTRRRSSRACLHCRARKVRCDVSHRGSPCTNCFLDSERCLVARRTSKYSRTDDAIRDDSQTLLPIDELMSHAETAEMPDELVAAENEDSPADEKPILIDGEATTFGLTNVGCRGTSQIITQDPPVELPFNLFEGLFDGHPLDASRGIFPTHNPSAFLHKSNRTNFHRQRPTTTDDPISSEVVYCRYPFLAITDIDRIPQEDFSFLELQGCLKVPIRPLLDEFVQQYFLHVHPILPIVNEGDFWDLYDGDGRHSPKEPITLLLFQAMLFAASTFISQSTVSALGYSDLRAMRAALLRRAKLLYDLDSDLSPLVVSQASVLLSTASLSSSGKPNTIWLSLAIANAKLVEAHLYTTMTSASCSKQRNVLKRLWWCCIIRDRSMGLLLKRPVQITKEQFDFSEDPLNSNDLKDELQRSKVYCPSTKSKLAEVLSQSVLLFIKLTDVLMLIYPQNGKPQSTSKEHDDSLLQLHECKSGLREWHLGAASKLQNHQSRTDFGLPKTDQASGHDSITLYMNLTYMYYHTARIVLCHHEALYLDMGGSDMISPLTKDPSRISETQRELQDAISDVIECHKELLRLDLAQWMPHSAMGFITVPLILNILDVKLSPPAMEGVHQSSTATQHQLNVLIGFMRAYWARYEGVDWITAIVRHIINLAQLNESRAQMKGSSINWVDIFAIQPRSYLRLVLVLDMSLSKGRLAQDADFPVKLRGLFSLNLNPLKELVERRRYNLESRNPLFQWGTQSSPFDSVLRDQMQLYTLGLDDCLFNTLENEIAFHQLMDTSLFQRQEWRGASASKSSLSQPIASLLNKPASGPECSEIFTTKGVETVGSNGSADMEYQAESVLELGDVVDEEVVDGLLGGLSENLGESVW
ncbi:fungal-specific transcription factor domain-containing protein [Ilyonectria robusta]|uniref:fungal-specific transcription factor domain-containing protein n=1 Tax=Ilyonectria robusta TaxID=1079257 RepID=UPI001E8CD2B0|nr:fungal-specific transcription factor domain-containing protein [Ilyonectria robusta]KAH8663236.1 fungal-specific transcription factor domain-containing protein [Ilyonectria robusta]